MVEMDVFSCCTSWSSDRCASWSIRCQNKVLCDRWAAGSRNPGLPQRRGEKSDRGLEDGGRYRDAAERCLLLPEAGGALWARESGWVYPKGQNAEMTDGWRVPLSIPECYLESLWQWRSGGEECLLCEWHSITLCHVKTPGQQQDGGQKAQEARQWLSLIPRMKL